ncbi:MAG: hypothetical protein GX265_00015 [Mollicutes bacterium]|nr:hypothetical protein [Mollicutes bacterium]
MKSRILLYLLGLILVLIISISLSYAYFTANFEDSETVDTITVTGGKMKIIYDGGQAIEVENLIPTDDPVSTKTFTVTGDNSTPFDMNYTVNLVIVSNTFSESAIKYKLTGENTNQNGAVIPNTGNLNNIGSGSKTINLGHGIFESPTDGAKVHTYTLEFYFLNAPYNQDIDKEKEINAYVEVVTYVDPCKEEDCLKNKILAQDGGEIAIREKDIPDFSKVAVSQETYDELPDVSEEYYPGKNQAVIENGIYATVDEYGVSYYYRGDKEYLNNNLLFGGYQWKIVRINGDGSIRLIYNGTEEDFELNDNEISEYSYNLIDDKAWNINADDAKYVGYMYGGKDEEYSITREQAVTNETDSNIKKIIDLWYSENIFGQPFENKIVDNLFCNDRQLQSEIGGDSTGTGYGYVGNHTRYAAYNRLNTNKTPTLKCGLKNDRFTVNDNIISNGDLTYPVGLLTADEAAMAGLVNDIYNQTNYLTLNGFYFWLETPYMMYISEEYGSSASMFVIYWSGSLGTYYAFEDIISIRPVISINAQVKVTGDGSATNPFRVS